MYLTCFFNFSASLKVSLRAKRSNLMHRIVSNKVEGSLDERVKIRCGESDCFVVSLLAMTYGYLK